MSNCVNILSNTLIPLTDINHLTLFAEMDRINDLEFSWEMPLEEQCFWWYLGRDNVYTVDDTHLCIEWGKHRSGHTWRDLKQTAHTLAKYAIVKDTIYCPCEMTDEYDNHQEIFKYDIPLERLKK